MQAEILSQNYGAWLYFLLTLILSYIEILRLLGSTVSFHLSR